MLFIQTYLQEGETTSLIVKRNNIAGLTKICLTDCLLSNGWLMPTTWDMTSKPDGDVPTYLHIPPPLPLHEVTDYLPSNKGKRTPHPTNRPTNPNLSTAHVTSDLSIRQLTHCSHRQSTLRQAYKNRDGRAASAVDRHSTAARDNATAEFRRRPLVCQVGRLEMRRAVQAGFRFCSQQTSWSIVAAFCRQRSPSTAASSRIRRRRESCDSLSFQCPKETEMDVRFSQSIC